MPLSNRQSYMLGTSPSFAPGGPAMLPPHWSGPATQQPRRNTGINWGSRFASGLVYAEHPAASNPGRGSLQTGFGLCYWGLKTPVPGVFFPSSLPALDGFTVMTVVYRRPTSPDGARGLCIRLTNNANSAGMELGIGAYNANRNPAFSFAHQDYVAGLTLAPGDYLPPIPAEGDVHVLGGVFRRGQANGAKLFVNGKIAASATTQDLGLFSNGTHALFISDRSGAPEDSNDRTPAMFGAVWSRGLSDAEMAELSKNPWQLFNAPQQLQWGAP